MDLCTNFVPSAPPKQIRALAPCLQGSFTLLFQSSFELVSIVELFEEGSKTLSFIPKKIKLYIKLFSTKNSAQHGLFLLTTVFYFLVNSIWFYFFYSALNYFISVVFLYSSPSQILLSYIFTTLHNTVQNHFIKHFCVSTYNIYIRFSLSLCILPPALCNAQGLSVGGFPLT